MNQGTPIRNQVIPPPESKNSGLLSPSGLYSGHADQNLVDQVTVLEREGPSLFWKLLLLDFLVLCSAAWFGFSSMRYLVEGSSGWFVLIAFLFWSAASVLEDFLQKKIPRRLLVILIETLLLVGFFFTYAWQVLIVTGFVIVCCLAWGYFSARRELRDSIQIRFFTASSGVIGKVITAALILLVAMYASISMASGSFFIPQSGFDAFFSRASIVAGVFFPGVPINGSFNDFAQTFAQNQLKTEPAYEKLSSAEQQQALTDATAQVTASFTPTPTPNESTSDVFYSYFAGLSSRLQDQFGDIFVLVWGLILFLILRSIGIIVVWIAQFFTLIFYEFFLAIGFMKITEATETKETIDVM